MTSYFALTLFISWAGVAAVALPVGIPAPPERTEELFGLALGLMMLGPSVGGSMMTGLTRGKAGLRELLERAGRWRVSWRWYALASLGMPLLSSVVLLCLSTTSPDHLPAIVTTDDPAALLLAGLGAGSMGALLEEPGWTGFAVRELRRRHGVVATSLTVGAVWGAWHVPITYWVSGDAAGGVEWEMFLPPFVFYLAVLPAFRVLMVWAHAWTDSLLIAMLMHGSLTATTLFVFAPSVTGANLILYYVVLAALLATLAAVVLRWPGTPKARRRSSGGEGSEAVIARRDAK